jgi:hypothetical protein
VDGNDGRRAVVWLDVCVKAALAATLVALAVEPGLREFSGRGVAGRVTASVVALAAVPAWWLVASRRGSRHGYPFALDAVLAVPFLVDLWGSAAGRGELAGGGSLGHVLDFALLTTAFALGFARLGRGAVATAALALGAAVAAAVLWELLEYATFAERTAEHVEDSVRDLGLALAASAAVAAVAWLVLARGRHHGRRA